ncbi:MAG TPA: aspartate/glutamate racemase family protein [Candidatus Binatia bacterium]
MPPDVCLVETRTLIHDVTAEGLAEMIKQVERAAGELASADVKVILQAGTAAAFFRGMGHDADLIRRITAATGIQATTSMTAVVDALRALGIRRPAIATPYIREMDEKLADVLRQSGFEIAGIEGLGIRRSIDMGALEPDSAYRLAREVVVRADKPDGILISCGNFRTFEIIEPLEAEYGLPVVTSNQAGLWRALRLAGIEDRIGNLGRLLEKY